MFIRSFRDDSNAHLHQWSVETWLKMHRAAQQKPLLPESKVSLKSRGHEILFQGELRCQRFQVLLVVLRHDWKSEKYHNLNQCCLIKLSSKRPSCQDHRADWKSIRIESDASSHLVGYAFLPVPLSGWKIRKCSKMKLLLYSQAVRQHAVPIDCEREGNAINAVELRRHIFMRFRLDLNTDHKQSYQQRHGSKAGRKQNYATYYQPEWPILL